MIQAIAAILFAVFIVNLVKTLLHVRGILSGVRGTRPPNSTGTAPRRFEAGKATVEDADFVEIKTHHP